MIEKIQDPQQERDAEALQVSAGLSEASQPFGVDLGESAYLQESLARRERISEVMAGQEVEKTSAGKGFAERITMLLEELLASGHLDGLTIVSDDGFVVAETYSLKNAEVMAAIGSVFEYVAERAQACAIVDQVDEMTIKGCAGEMAVVRYFPNLGRRFFLMAYARKSCAYRHVTNLALKRCGILLLERFGD
ncbi:MAG: roadblock/LC7 domain-containing protein [Verrucomicrobiales bacterium]|nr:roadblock/LC7 domain-containing protein [Verrucomicrobiales bacterium]